MISRRLTRKKMGQAPTRKAPSCQASNGPFPTAMDSLGMDGSCGPFDDGLIELTTERDNYLLNTNKLSQLEMKLPSEIMMHILKFMTLKDLVVLSGTSQNFRKFWTIRCELLESNKPFRLLISPSTQSPLFKLFFYNHFQKKITDTSMINIPSMQDHSLYINIIGAESSGRRAFVNAVKGIPIGDEHKPQIIGTEFTALSLGRENITFKLVFFVMNDLHGPLKRNNQHINFLFDLNNVNSFNNMTNLVDQFKVRLGISQLSDMNQTLLQTNCSMCIVGTKCDLERKVSEQEITSFLNSLIPSTGIPVKQLRIQYYEISSKQGCCVMDPIKFSLATYNPACAIQNDAVVCVK